MNFGAIAAAVGMRLGVATSDPASREGMAVRSSLSMRHDQIFRSFLWKDAVLEYVLPIDPNPADYVVTDNYMPTKGRVICPSIIQQVLGVRLGWRSLKVERPEFYYRADYARFFQSEWVGQFELLSSAVWEFDTPQAVTVSGVTPADGSQVTTDILASDEVTLNRVSTAIAPAGNAVGTTDRIDTIIQGSTLTALTFSVAGKAFATLTNQNASAAKCQRIQLVGTPQNSSQLTWPLHILGKRTTPPFAAETDTPAINGLDGILFALAIYDYCTRDERGVAEAAALMVEAVGQNFLTTGKPGGFLGKLIEEEVIQAAFNSRIIPQDGFGRGGFDEPTGSKSEPYCQDW